MSVILFIFVSILRYVSASTTAVWIGEFLSKSLWGFAPVPASNFICANHSRLYKQQLSNLTLWAVQMLDSSALAPSGLVVGDVYQLGHFDSCLDVKAPIATQYCLPTIQYGPSPIDYASFYQNDKLSDAFDSLNMSLSVWEKIKVTQDLRKIKRDTLYWGLCLPASCKPDEIENELVRTLELNLPADVDLLHINTTLKNVNCYNPSLLNDRPLGFYIMCSLILVLILCVITGFVIDVVIGVKQMDDPSSDVIKKAYKNNPFLQMFSVRLNMKKLIKKDKTNEFNALNGFKIMLLFFVVTGHRGLYNMGAAVIDPEYVEKVYESVPHLFLTNGNFVVDGYLTISGLLTFFKVYPMLVKNNGRISILALTLYRWMRIIPVYMFTVAFYALLLPYIGKGPIWMERAIRESERCRNNWWTNLLFINNYFRNDEQCLLVSWYLACDLHLFIVGSILTLFVWKYSKYAYHILSAVLIASIAIPFAIIYSGPYYGVLRSYLGFYTDPTKWFDFYEIYGKSHNRAQSYIMGIFNGYILYKLKKKKINFPPWWLAWSTIGIFVTTYSMLCLGGIFYFPDHEYDALENALYGSLHRVLFTFYLHWIVTVQIIWGWELIKALLCHKWFTPLSRLSLCVLLIHPFLQFYEVTTLRSPQFYTFPKGYYIGVADIVVGFAFSLIMYLIVEAPCATLQNLMFALLIYKKKPQPSHKPCNENPDVIAAKDEVTRV